MRPFLEIVLEMIVVFILAGIMLGVVWFLTRTLVPFIFSLV